MDNKTQNHDCPHARAAPVYQLSHQNPGTNSTVYAFGSGAPPPSVRQPVPAAMNHRISSATANGRAPTTLGFFAQAPGPEAIDKHTGAIVG